MSGGRPSIRVHCTREYPKEWAGRKIAGQVGVYDELPDEEMIRQDHGGGHFRLIVKQLDDKGRFVYAPGGHVLVKIAGKPKVPENASMATSPAYRNTLRKEVERIVVQILAGRKIAG